MTFWENFAVTVVLAGFISAAISLWQEKRLADYKDDIERRSFEHRTRFSELHERRAEIIAQLYQRMVNTYRLIQLDSLPMPTFVDEHGNEVQDTGSERAFKAYLDFSYFYDENKIYFTKAQCKTLDGLSGLMSKGSLATQPYQKHVEDPEVKRFVKAQLQEALTEIPQVLESLEDTFRELLGIELDETEDSTLGD